ncbi:unnamed protein product [Pylaiella littoralis]
MFTCCALFNLAEDDPADTEHLDALDEVDPTKQGDIRISIGEDGSRGSGEFDRTPLASSPRFSAALQGADDAGSAAQHAETEELMARVRMSEAEAEGRAAAEAETTAQDAARSAETETAPAGEPGAAAQTGTNTANAETMRALREAESAVQAAEGEAEQRRVEEEESAIAARQAESEAKQAMWRAEESQKVKEQVGTQAAEEAREAHRIAREGVSEEREEKAELARRQAAAARTQKAKDHLMSKLLSDEGLRLQKHGRNGKSVFRTLKSSDSECATLTWGRTLHDLRLMQEVRKGTDADPANPGATGTSELRRSKAASAALERSFSLLFPSRSLDFTVASNAAKTKYKTCPPPPPPPRPSPLPSPLPAASPLVFILNLHLDRGHFLCNNCSSRANRSPLLLPAGRAANDKQTQEAFCVRGGGYLGTVLE